MGLEFKDSVGSMRTTRNEPKRKYIYSVYLPSLFAVLSRILKNLYKYYHYNFRFQHKIETGIN